MSAGPAVAWPDHIERQWVLMRVVRAGVATETEIRQHWDIGRLADWYDVLLFEREADLQMSELQQRAMEDARRGG